MNIKNKDDAYFGINDMKRIAVIMVLFLILFLIMGVIWKIWDYLIGSTIYFYFSLMIAYIALAKRPKKSNEEQDISSFIKLFFMMLLELISLPLIFYLVQIDVSSPSIEYFNTLFEEMKMYIPI